jgi:O-antigen/teichoic acid export membrane protein
VAYFFIDWATILKAAPVMRTELNLLAAILILLFCLQLIFNLITNLLFAVHKPAVASQFTLLTNLLLLISVFVLTQFNGRSILVLGIINGLIPVAILVCANLYYFSKQFKPYIPSKSAFDFGLKNQIFSLGMKFFLIQVSVMILFSITNVIIIRFFSPIEVTQYNIAFKYYSSLNMVFGIILTPFWNAFTEAYLKNELDWIKKTIKKLLLIWLIFLILVIIMTIFSDAFYHFWIKDAVSIPLNLSIAMGGLISIINWHNLFGFFTNGISRISIQFYTSITMIILNIPLAYFFVKGLNMGIPGVLLSNILCLLIGSTLLPVQTIKILRGKAKGIWDK